MSSKAIALQIMAMALHRLAHWTQANVTVPENRAAIATLKGIETILPWPDQSTPFTPLNLLFEQIQLQHSPSKPSWYWPPTAIANNAPTIPYPVSQSQAADLQPLQTEIKQAIESLTPEDWQNSSLLSLIIEKYGSSISLGNTAIAFSDLVKITAAVAAALAPNPKAKTFTLIGADLSGIQPFIYTIAAAGALKSLRARSFFLELITEEVIQQLLQTLTLPRTNVIYSGGGKVYLLAPASTQNSAHLNTIGDRFNQWFIDDYQGKISLSLTHLEFPIDHVKDERFVTHWEALNRRLNHRKGQKFGPQLQDFLAVKDTSEPCKVCHRDDTPKLKPLNGDGPEACCTCRNLFNLGGKLFGVNALIRSPIPPTNPDNCFQIFSDDAIYYRLSQQQNPKLTAEDSLLLINNWTIDDYRSKGQHLISPLLIGNYGQDTPDTPTHQRFLPAEEFAQKSQGIQRIAYLRMDVDRLGQIFAQGLAQSQPSLVKLASLSRLLSLFFKVYLNSLAADRQVNILDQGDRFQHLTTSDRKDLLFIYAGGDDVFISGTWDQVVEFSFDLYQAFRSYTGQNPNITLSAGISLQPPKYPLYQAAEEAGDAEEKAKKDGRDRLTLFGETFSWSEWLKPSSNGTIKSIMPLVKLINKDLDQLYSRNFVRALLQVVKTQDQLIEKIQARSPSYAAEVKHVRTALHLPAIAYMLSRLPQSITRSENFPALRQSLLSQHNAPYYRAIATWISLLNRSDTNPAPKENNHARP